MNSYVPVSRVSRAAMNKVTRYHPFLSVLPFSFSGLTSVVSTQSSRALCRADISRFCCLHNTQAALPLRRTVPEHLLAAPWSGWAGVGPQLG